MRKILLYLVLFLLGSMVLAAVVDRPSDDAPTNADVEPTAVSNAPPMQAEPGSLMALLGNIENTDEGRHAVIVNDFALGAANTGLERPDATDDNADSIYGFRFDQAVYTDNLPDADDKTSPIPVGATYAGTPDEIYLESSDEWREQIGVAGVLITQQFTTISSESVQGFIAPVDAATVDAALVAAGASSTPAPPASSIYEWATEQPPKVLDRSDYVAVSEDDGQTTFIASDSREAVEFATDTTAGSLLDDPSFYAVATALEQTHTHTLFIGDATSVLDDAKDRDDQPYLATGGSWGVDPARPDQWQIRWARMYHNAEDAQSGAEGFQDFYANETISNVPYTEVLDLVEVSIEGTLVIVDFTMTARQATPIMFSNDFLARNRLFGDH